MTMCLLQLIPLYNFKSLYNQNYKLANYCCCHVKGQFSVFIHYTGATYIKKMLMDNKKLETLNISYNNLGDDGVRHITEVQQNDTLTKLNIQDCEISVKGNYS